MTTFWIDSVDDDSTLPVITVVVVADNDGFLSFCILQKKGSVQMVSGDPGIGEQRAMMQQVLAT